MSLVYLLSSTDQTIVLFQLSFVSEYGDGHAVHRIQDLDHPNMAVVQDRVAGRSLQ